jgi:molybdopterin molybdotransferase
VRRQGEQFKIGTPILKAGTPISPQALGLLLSAGVGEVDLRERPRVAVVVTGDEFADPSSPAPGKIFNSNGAMVAAVLQREGVVCNVLHAPDDLEVLQVVLRDALARHDLLITTGGVSVGDKDLVRPALEALGTEVLAHNVAQKPGKPMLIGRHKDCPVLGLPGNPRAVLVLCWEYVLPALRCMQGAYRPLPRVDRLPLAGALELSGKRAEFRAARVTGGRVQLLADQGSHMLASLLEADALAYFPIGVADFEQGAVVEVHYLP